MTKTRFYLAYGSNLNKEQMARRCPAAQPLGWFTLHDNELVFRGVADVVRKKGASVPVGLWQITPKCEAALDRYEGVASRLYRREWVRIEHDGAEHRALIYRMNRGAVWLPNSSYLQAIIDGYADFGIDHAPVQDALRRAYEETEGARAGKAA